MKKLLALISLAVLCSCADAPPPAVKPVADLTPPINLDVLMINIVDHTAATTTNSPYNTNNFQPTIANAIRDWAVHKLVAVGTTGQAIVIIDDASLESKKLPHEDDMFKRQQASEYIGHAGVSIQISGREGQANLTTDASRYETLPEDPSPLERQNAYYTLLNGLMHDLGAKLKDGIQSHIGAFVVTAPIMKGAN